MFEKFLKILLIFLVLLLIYKCTIGSPFSLIRMNLGIKLPMSDKITYKSDTCSKPYIMCAEYTIIKYKSNRKIKKLNTVNWKTEKDIAIENKILK